MLISPEHIQRLADIIERYSQTAHEVSFKYNGYQFEGEQVIRQYVAVTFIQRAVYNSTVISHTLGLRGSIGGYDNPMALIARGGVLDFLLLLSLQVKLSESFDAHDDQAYKILSDHLSHSWSQFSKELKDYYINSLPGGFFETDNNGNKSPKYRDTIKIKDLERIIKANPKCERYLPAFDVYLFLSKYEHFGIFTLEFKKRREIFQPYYFKNLVASIIYILEGLILTIGALQQNEFLPALYQELEKVINLFEDID